MKVTLLVLFGIFLLGVLMMYLGQANLIYFPQRYSTKAKALKQVERITYLSDERNQSIYLYPKNLVEVPERVWWVFGGNGSVALNWVDLVAAAEPDVSQAYVLFDYPGYGFSGGRPSPSSIVSSVDASMQHVAKELNMTVEELTRRSAAMGHSLGGAVALDTAGRHGFGDVVMVSPFTTMKEMARRRVGPVVSLLLTHHYDNESALERWLESPRSRTLTVFHGDSDRLIPISMGQAIAAKAEAAGKGEFVSIRAAGHNDIIDVIGGVLVSILESEEKEATSGE